MSLCGKFVSESEINAPAHKLYKMLKHKCYDVPNICPNIVQKVEMHEGDWDSHDNGSIKMWYYTIDGKPEVFKERVEFDDEKLVIFLTGLEGDVFKHYKTKKVTFQAVPKGPNHCLAVLTLDFEKLHDDCPHPHKYLDLLTNFIKSLESHLKE